MSALRVEDLRVELLDGTPVIEQVSFEIEKGKVLGLVGESGCGKTTAAMALLAFARPGSRIAGGRVLVGGEDILALGERALQKVRGARVSFVPQDPAGSLNPAMRIGRQVEEMLLKHAPHGRSRMALVRDSLRRVHLDPPEAFLERYPHQLSGGQQQRVAIAMALVCTPGVIVLDEPTTGLDVTTQARILEVIDELRRTSEISLLYVSHDLGVVSHFADEVVVMYGGRVVESGPTRAVFFSSRHPYTRKLLAAMPRSDVSGHQPKGIRGVSVAPRDRPNGCPFAPRCELRVSRCTVEFPPEELAAPAHRVACFRWEATEADAGSSRPLELAGARGEAMPRLTVENLVASYPRSHVRGDGAAALNGVSLHVLEGECLAVVGESGSGKTTLARCLVGIRSPESGRILLDGVPLASRSRLRSDAQRQRIQIVFQNPDESLNPRQTVLKIVSRPVEQFERASRREARRRAVEALERVRLDVGLADRYPRDLSGGEKQRVAIARALVARPQLLICDEITSALDVSVQAAILELMRELRATGSFDMSMIFISHDLAVVRSIADRIVVLEKGDVCELARTEDVFEMPSSEYTQALIRAQQDWSLESSGPASVAHGGGGSLPL